MDLKKFEIWLKNNTTLKANSRKKYVAQVRKFLNEYGEVNIKNLTKFLLEKHRGDRLVYYRKFAIKYFLTFLGKKDLLDDLKPVFRQIRLQERRFLREIPDFEKFKEFLQILSPKLSVLLMVMYDTAGRIGALLKLKVRDIGEDENGYYVNLHEKRGRLLRRYIEPITYEALKTIIRGKAKDEPVFLLKRKEASWSRNPRGDPEQYLSLEETYLNYYKELKVKSRKFALVSPNFGISFHFLRTTRGRKLYRQYRDLVLVKDYLGHASITTTMRYIDRGELDSSEIIKKERKWG